MGQSAAELFNDTDLLEDGEVMEQEDELVEDEEDFVCDKCRGVFLASRRALHLLKCIGSRKRTASARRTTSTVGPTDPSSSPERARRPTKKTKPLFRALASSTRTASSSSRNIKSRLRSATPAALVLGESDEDADQLEDDEITISRDGGAEDGDEEDEDEEGMGNRDGDDDYEDDAGPEDEDNGFGEESAGDHRAGSSVRVPSLCPFCDEILPRGISPAFKDALASALRSAIPQPLPSNPDHHELEWTRSIGVCSIHRAQTASIASGLSWPTSINFDQIPVRLLAHRQDLLAVLEGASTAHVVLEGFREGSYPLTNMSAKVGALKYSHAGYYGPQGYQLLCSSLLRMFSGESANCSSVLSYFDFVHYVLAPYASFLLIRDDLSQGSMGSEEVWKKWKYSKAHGEAFFPEI
ncbi:hypothetical protein M407DRAFT_242795 [Tulasnella calospora MUT 4182]|uniref:Restriction of telomere capping protein 4 n=1 Tax=Tulasnella calospora MUT 4182 TaxID=1051891 RepID=A0A0C3QDF2_9AGAM|nr:hypothetical protein M407DRAFT_242795 [Tulasnella calospora MUT 4182]